MIWASMASLSSRHRQREETIKSLAPQVTSITWHNGDIEGDKLKFKEARAVDGYFFAVDDDLIFPADYVERMIKKLQEYDNKIIVTCQGRTVDYIPVDSYYRSGWTKYSCLSELTEDKWVNIPGSGVCAFHTDFFKPNLDCFLNGFMADLFLAFECQKNKIPILCMAHPANWIIHQETGGGIYEQYRNNDTVQTNFVNSIDWKLYVR